MTRGQVISLVPAVSVWYYCSHMHILSPCSGGPGQSGCGAAVQEDRHPTQGEIADVCMDVLDWMTLQLHAHSRELARVERG